MQIQCRTCKETKPEASFLTRKGRLFTLRCRTCEGRYAKNLFNKRIEQGQEDSYLRKKFMVKRNNIRRMQPGSTITISDLKEIHIKQGGRCALSGLPFNSDNDGLQHWNSMSVDRIEAGGPYSKDNCRLVLNAVNSMRGTASDDTVYMIAQALVDFKKR